MVKIADEFHTQQIKKFPNNLKYQFKNNKRKAVKYCVMNKFVDHILKSKTNDLAFCLEFPFFI